MTIPSFTAEVEAAHSVIFIRLDLGRAGRRKRYQALKERYRARPANRPVAESDPGVGEALLEEVGSLAEACRRATTEKRWARGRLPVRCSGSARGAYRPVGYHGGRGTPALPAPYS